MATDRARAERALEQLAATIAQVQSPASRPRSMTVSLGSGQYTVVDVNPHPSAHTEPVRSRQPNPNGMPNS